MPQWKVIHGAKKNVGHFFFYIKKKILRILYNPWTPPSLRGQYICFTALQLVCLSRNEIEIDFGCAFDGGEDGYICLVEIMIEKC